MVLPSGDSTNAEAFSQQFHYTLFVKNRWYWIDIMLFGKIGNTRLILILFVKIDDIRLILNSYVQSVIFYS